MGKAGSNCSCNSCQTAGEIDVKRVEVKSDDPDKWLTELDATAKKRAATTTKPPSDKLVPPAPAKKE